MAFSGSYVKYTPQNGSTSETDFLLIVYSTSTYNYLGDDFWSDSDTDDGTRARVAKDDGVTEVPFDPIYYDTTTKTLLFAIKYSGTYASVGANTVRLYPAKTTNSSYGASDTYGQYNAYLSTLQCCLPFYGSLNDRTSNGLNGTSVGGPTYTSAAAGQGVEEEVSLTDNPLTSTDGFTILGMFDVTSSNTDLIEDWSTSFLLRTNSGNVQLYTKRESATIGPAAVTAGTGEHFFAGRYIYSGDQNSWYDSTKSSGVSDPTNQDLDIGSQVLINDGAIANYSSHVQIYSEDKSDNWIDLTYDQLSDNASFCGTWTYQGTGNTLTAEKGSFALTGYAAGLHYGRVVSAGQGSFSLTGYAATLKLDRVVLADTGNYLLDGKDVSLLFDRIVIAESGAFILDGKDATLTLGANKTIQAESGAFVLDGKDAGLKLNRVLSAESGSFTLTGYDAQLTWSGQPVASGKVTVSFTSRAPSATMTSKAPNIEYEV